MLNLFTVVNESTIRLTSYETGEIYFDANLNKAIAYYQNRTYPNQVSPIVRVISILDNEEPLTSAYLRKVNANKIAACNSVGITTKVDRGYGSEVYGMPADKVYMIMNDSKRLDTSHWTRIIPIRPLQYKYNNCTFTHPSDMLKTDTMIISIDIVNLMYMYKKYKEYHQLKELPYTISDFLMSYVYTNMIGCFFRLALLNNYLFDTPLFWLDENPFTMLSLKPHIRRMMRIVKRRRHKQALYYGDYIELLPLMSKKFEDMFKINTMMSRANTWLWLAVYIPFLEALITSRRLHVHSKINTGAHNELLFMGKFWLGNDSYFSDSFDTKNRLKAILKFIKDEL